VSEMMKYQHLFQPKPPADACACFQACAPHAQGPMRSHVTAALLSLLYWLFQLPCLGFLCNMARLPDVVLQP
jgi:hypothetical protein